MLTATIKLYGLLSSGERSQALKVLALISCVALVDVIGVASILPFMAVLANPNLIESNALLSLLYVSLKFDNYPQFIFMLGLLFFCFTAFSLALKAFALFSQLRFSLRREYSIGCRLLEGYLQQPYSWFLNRNSAELGKAVLSQVNFVIYNTVLPALILVSQGAAALALLILLLIVDMLLAVVVGSVIGAAYGALYRYNSRLVKRLGQQSISANENRFKTVNEAFGAVKEVKLGSLESIFIGRFSAAAETYANNAATAQVVAQIPRFFLEGVAFGGLLLVILFFMAQKRDFSEVIPIMALYALAGYRLLPAVQQIYGACISLRFGSAALFQLHHDLQNYSIRERGVVGEKKFTRKTIQLSNIAFRYPGSSSLSLDDICLSIPAKSTVGFVGPTGSGKTTVVDIILGLLEPTSGTLSVDGCAIDRSNVRDWQRNIGYVPQQIYLSDDSIAANIAFGVNPLFVDHEAVQHAAKIANLHDFVVNELPDGYQTLVGERGIRLSGGQRQRIGIARAVYHKPEILVLDEATSALDSLTEQAVMEAVYNLGHRITVIMVAHRLSTVSRCDIIFLLEKGRLTDQGSFGELLESSARFRAMSALP